MNLSGHVELILRDKEGHVKLYRRGKNIVTTTGKTLCAQALEGVATVPTHFAFGDTATVASEADTALANELGSTRTAVVKSRTLNQLTYSCTYTNGTAGTQIFREAGIFNAASVGTILSRWVTQKFSILVGESIDVRWTLTFGGA